MENLVARKFTSSVEERAVQDNAESTLTYLRRKNPIAASNYSIILQLNDEMTKLVDNLDSKIGERITKDESHLINSYKEQMRAVKAQIDVVMEAQAAAERQAAENCKDRETRDLKETIKRQNEDIQRYVEQCRNYREQVQTLTLVNEQLRKDHEGCEERIKKHAMKNIKLNIQLKTLEDKLAMSKSIEDLETNNLSKSINNITDKFNENLFQASKTKEQVRTVRYYETTIENLRRQLRTEQRTVQRLKLQKMHVVSSRSELENIFLECVEEVRYRILSEKTAPDLDLALLKTPILPEDKVKIMECFMANDRLLKFLYDVMFTKNFAKESVELPSLLSKLNPFVSVRKQTIKNKSFISCAKETPELSFEGIAQLRANEMKIRKQLLSTPVHSMNIRNNLTNKSTRFRDKLLGVRLAIG
eukprot:TRINITY_DN9559_c0_g1_i9.p1 TRINITY_DN9559_c0_g1~~TRINITY_DN9559_c0_g1_i9.p1  ORF type:complete len:417 (+),score=134.96 TRINITY_DN9559_c0_g1_i9:95-1345(+)